MKKVFEQKTWFKKLKLDMKPQKIVPTAEGEHVPVTSLYSGESTTHKYDHESVTEVTPYNRYSLNTISPK